MSSSVFPPEIETEILTRLPAKTLQRFKLVCKNWNSQISNDVVFKSTFHNHALQNPNLLFINNPVQFSVSKTRKLPLIEATQLALPLPGVLARVSRIELINSNSVNGVLGVLVHFGGLGCEMIVWNPATCETVRVPNSAVSGLFNGVPMVKFYTGFGYDKTGLGVGVGGDYKFVRVVFLGVRRCVGEVYSIRGNCWKKLDSLSGISSSMLWASEMCTFVDGFGYWGVHTCGRKDRFLVLGFDFSGEGFKRITVPDWCVDGVEKKYHSLWEFRGALALSVLHFGGFETGLSRIYVWVLSGNWGEDEGFTQSWQSVFNIDLECGPRRPVTCLRSGELVLLGDEDGEHVLYDPVTRNVKRLSVLGVDHVVHYVESLESLRNLMPVEDEVVLTCENDTVGCRDKLDSLRLLPKHCTIAEPVEADVTDV